jgi:hypothetical protein
MSEEVTVNVPLLRKTLDWAYGEWQKAQRGEISEWFQNHWMIDTLDIAPRDINVSAAVRSGAACGTSCCIAGKVAYDAGWRPAYSYGSSYAAHPDKPGEKRLIRDVAEKLLGLNGWDSTDLFRGSNTIYDLYETAERITNGEITMPPELAGHHG